MLVGLLLLLALAVAAAAALSSPLLLMRGAQYASTGGYVYDASLIAPFITVISQLVVGPSVLNVAAEQAQLRGLIPQETAADTALADRVAFLQSIAANATAMMEQQQDENAQLQQQV